jgi:hypothetical protein
MMPPLWVSSNALSRGSGTTSLTTITPELRRCRAREPSPGSELAPWERVLSE